MIISIASGKGGTGKTTVAVNLALSIPNAQLIDCDAEEPNDHIFIKPEIGLCDKAVIPVPEICVEKCDYCGKCAEVCAYHAIAVVPPGDCSNGNVLVFSHLCHGCGACRILCPRGAIKEVDKEIGIIESGMKKELLFVQGRLNIGEAMSPPVIRQARRRAYPSRTVIIDAPPGTSCPVITAVKGSDVCVLVTEPTPFGLHDLTLAVGVLRELKIPFGIVINRSDAGDGRVEEYCAKEGVSVLMKIPFSREIAAGYSRGVPLIESDASYRDKFVELYSRILGLSGCGTRAA